jgi:hypothetical protein
MAWLTICSEASADPFPPGLHPARLVQLYLDPPGLPAEEGSTFASRGEAPSFAAPQDSFDPQMAALEAQLIGMLDRSERLRPVRENLLSLLGGQLDRDRVFVMSSPGDHQTDIITLAVDEEYLLSTARQIAAWIANSVSDLRVALVPGPLKEGESLFRIEGYQSSLPQGTRLTHARLDRPFMHVITSPGHADALVAFLKDSRDRSARRALWKVERPAETRADLPSWAEAILEGEFAPETGPPGSLSYVVVPADHRGEWETWVEARTADGLFAEAAPYGIDVQFQILDDAGALQDFQTTIPLDSLTVPEPGLFGELESVAAGDEAGIDAHKLWAMLCPPHMLRRTLPRVGPVLSLPMGPPVGFRGVPLRRNSVPGARPTMVKFTHPLRGAVRKRL